MATENQKLTAWENAKKVRGKDPDLYRRDPFGNVIFWRSYGKHSPMGWEVDHWRPKSRGGSNSPRNLVALQTSWNRWKGGRPKGRPLRPRKR